MDKYEVTPGVLNIAETCAASLSINDLTKLCEDPSSPSPLDLNEKLNYGSIRGSPALRGRLAALYAGRIHQPLTEDNILITPGAIAANFLLLYSLIGPGDHVICVHPTYQQLYSVPEQLGAEVALWKLRREKKYIPDMEDLQRIVKPSTKMIIINNPNNPTGATIPKSVLTDLIEFAKKRDIIILSDEVYRPLFHGISPVDNDYPPSLVSFGYEKAIVTGSMSKAYSLAGIRVGWIACRSKEIIEQIAAARDYTTISVSKLDEAVAAYALGPSVIHALLSRNIKLAKTNIALLETFVKDHSSLCSWVKPTGGTTAYVKFLSKPNGPPIDDVQLCVDMLEKTKVLLVPGSKCFGEVFKGFVRIGFVCETSVLQEALAKMKEYFAATSGDDASVD